jgi:heme-degrading monooxygenase HmoA
LDAAPQAEYVLIIHEVDDYPKWKDIFDAAVDIRRTAGEIDYQLLASNTNERRVVHFSRWRSLRAAQLFFESEELVRIRREAGVKAPEFLYLRQIEQGAL